MRLTTLRVLVAMTTILVIAAGTCLATFGQTPSDALSLPACEASALVPSDGARTARDGTSRATFVVRNAGPPCALGRNSDVALFDAAGRALPVTVAPRFHGRVLFTLVPLAFEPGGTASFAATWSTAGTSCEAASVLAVRIGSGDVRFATDLAPCVRPDGSNLSLSFVETVSESGSPRTRADVAGSNSPQRL